MACNGFSANVRTSIIRRLKSKYNVNSNEHNHTATEKTENDLIDDIRPKIWIRVPFLGKQSEFLVKKLLKKIQRINLTQAVKFVVIYDTKKVSYFLPEKDEIPNFFAQQYHL